MRTCALYIDQGSGWVNHTGHAQDVAGLMGFTIEWGETSFESSPSANVLHFQLLDRTGVFAGRVSQLLGSRVLMQITRTPSWGDLMATAPASQSWSMVGGTWSELHEDYWTDPYSAPDTQGITLFDGFLTTGGTVTKLGDGKGWRLDLYASSLTVMLDRDENQGPVSNGRQWAGTPAAMIQAVRQRITADGVWDMSDQTAQRLTSIIPDALGGWKTDEQVSTSQALDQLTNWNPSVIHWYERHTPEGDWMEPWALGETAKLAIHDDGHLSVVTATREQDVQPASAIMVDAAAFDIPQPYASMEISGLSGDENASFTIDATQLPNGLRQSGKTIKLSSTIRLDKWQPDTGMQDDARQLIEAQDTRLTPSGIAIDQTRVSLDDYPSLYTPGPSLWAILQSAYADLFTGDGTPAVAGPWIAISGTVTFQWRDHRPVFRHDLTLSPLPLEWDPTATWSNIGIPLPWSQMQMTWAELSMMTYEA